MRDGAHQEKRQLVCGCEGTAGWVPTTPPGGLSVLQAGELETLLEWSGLGALSGRPA